ncbi:MAG: hypothetical protein ACI9FZ_000222 [Bacteroidia bacterium]|jgi:hypothetical protein
MSKLKELIAEKKSTTSTIIATTLRLTEENHSFVDELAEFLGKSKHETLVTLLEDGIYSAKTHLKLEEPEAASDSEDYYLLNTNKRNNAQDGKWMLDQKAAAAFYNPWKRHINSLKENDVVFLYENGVGIVAYGWATGETEVADYQGDSGETHFQKLLKFEILAEPLKAREIKKLLNYDLVFLKTMSPVRDGEKILVAIGQIKGTKR